MMTGRAGMCAPAGDPTAFFFAPPRGSWRQDSPQAGGGRAKYPQKVGADAGGIFWSPASAAASVWITSSTVGRARCRIDCGTSSSAAAPRRCIRSLYLLYSGVRLRRISATSASDSLERMPTVPDRRVGPGEGDATLSGVRLSPRSADRRLGVVVLGGVVVELVACTGVVLSSGKGPMTGGAGTHVTGLAVSGG